jgi:peptidoglycan lytic transglycosylase B
MTPLRLSRRALLGAPLLALPFSLRAQAAEEGFSAFLESMRKAAIARGLRASSVEKALGKTRFLPHVIELDHHQPEQVLTFEEYLDKVVTPEREDHARRHLDGNWDLLYGIGRRYRVDPRLIVALWGIESNFGGNMGDYAVPSAVATLAFDGRRGAYFRGQLMAALKILDEGDVPFAAMIGSWAGAMGQCQFMPSTFLDYAVDYDGDGRRDIWGDRADVLASVANFLSRLGWRDGESWGEEVLLPSGFDKGLAGLGQRRSLAEWRRLGVETLDLRPLHPRAEKASLILPGGREGPALLVYENFRTILRWNNSTYFAAAVGFLADSMGRG